MKLFKRTASVLLAISMTAMLTTTALAVDTEREVPTEEPTTGYMELKDHTYSVFQIFSGTQATDNNALLCDIQWGVNVDGDGLLAELNKLDAYKDCKTAEDVAKVLAKFLVEYGNDSTEIRAFARLAHQFKTGTGTDIDTLTNIDEYKYNDPVTGEEKSLGAGYYLVVDTTETDGKENEAKNLSLLQVTKNTSMNTTSKTDIPMVEKKVLEETIVPVDETDKTGYSLKNYVNGEFDGRIYNDVADYDIGDDVPFMLIGTMPTTIADYAQYRYVFHDTLSAGLSYNDDVAVYLDNDNDASVQYEINPACYAVSEDNGYLKISFADVKNIKDTSDVALEVSKDSKIIVKYTAELNDGAEIGLPGNPNEVYLQYSNNPNFIGDGTQNPDNPDNPNPDENDDENTGKTPVDKVIVFTYQLDVTKLDNEDTTKALQGAEFILKNSDGKFYNEDAEDVRWVDDRASATPLTSDVNGFFSVVGIDEGTYALEETKAPTGYNLLKEDITITVTAVTNNTQEWDNFLPEVALTGLTIKVENNNNATAGDGNVESGTVNMNVYNSKGSLLPETGGMGTVLIYTVGAILAVGSVVLLVTKKRMNK